MNCVGIHHGREISVSPGGQRVVLMCLNHKIRTGIDRLQALSESPEHPRFGVATNRLKDRFLDRSVDQASILKWCHSLCGIGTQQCMGICLFGP